MDTARVDALLDTIDGALDDDSISDDAMRWAPPENEVHTSPTMLAEAWAMTELLHMDRPDPRRRPPLADLYTSAVVVDETHTFPRRHFDRIMRTPLVIFTTAPEGD